MIYIALLGGINVGGHSVKMERLRQLFTQLGFTNVRSYIQTGNVFFETDHDDRHALTQVIEVGLQEVLGYHVPVLLRTIPEVEALRGPQSVPAPPGHGRYALVCAVFG